MQTQPVTTQQSSKFVPALLGGVIMAVFALPILSYVNCLCCAGIMLGGFLGVLFYKNKLTGDMMLTSGDGIAIGALAGVFGAVLATFISVATMMFATSMSAGMTDVFQQFEERGVELPGFVREMLDDILSGRLNTMLVFFVFLFNIILYPLFGLLGGLIGAAVFKPKKLPVVPPTPPPVV
jgi:hypothetical protein